MELDIKTLSFVLLITFLVQVIAFLLMIFTVKNYKGITLWATGVFFISLGFGTVFLRSYIDNNGLLIFSTNFFHIGGLMLFYIGSSQFLDHHKKIYFLISSLVIYLLVIYYYTFINDSLKARFILYSAAEVFFLSINAWLLLKYSKKSYRKASIFVSSIFILNSLFFLYRIIYYLFNRNPYLDFFSINNMQSITMLISIGAGLLWTFGLIILVSQRLNGELAESKNLFELIFNTIPEGIVISDKQNYEFLNTNPGFCSITGYSREEIRGNKTFGLQLLLDSNDTVRLKSLFRNNNYFNNQSVTIHDKKGNQVVGLVSSRSFRYNDKDCILTIGRNITDLKQKELELAKKTHELEKMICEKDKFFSILAHDLRGSIATAVNLTELMSDRKNDFSKEDFLRFSGSLNKSINSTNELLDNLLEWTGLNKGLNNFNPIQTTFADVMGHFIPNLASLAEDKKITLSNDIPDNTPFFADVHMAQTIFRNLIANAIKFSKEQGHIRLSVLKQDNGKTIFSVADNGIGMNAKILESLFQVNAKNNRPGTNGEPSSGLGLLLCKDFVEKHNGKIWVESEVDKGSTFYLTFDTD